MNGVNSCYKYCPKCAGLLAKRYGVNPQCEKCGFVLFLNVRAVVVGVATKNGKVLLEQRAIEPEIDKWSLIGGFVDFAEQPQEALIREVKEEIGCRCKIVKFLGFFPVNSYTFKDETFATLPLVYEIKVFGTLTTSKEVKNVQWFDLNALPKLAWGNQKDLLEKIRKEHLRFEITRGY